MPTSAVDSPAGMTRFRLSKTGRPDPGYVNVMFSNCTSRAGSPAAGRVPESSSRGASAASSWPALGRPCSIHANATSSQEMSPNGVVAASIGSMTASVPSAISWWNAA
jgi:hypothetical protein